MAFQKTGSDIGFAESKSQLGIPHNGSSALFSAQEFHVAIFLFSSIAKKLYLYATRCKASDPPISPGVSYDPSGVVRSGFHNPFDAGPVSVSYTDMCFVLLRGDFFS